MLNYRKLSPFWALCGVAGLFIGYLDVQAAIAENTTAVEVGDLTLVGRVATAEEVHAWDHDVRPDGLGLPEGEGSVEFGEEVYSEHCAVCHGDFAEGAGRWPILAGGQGTLTSNDPVKTIGSYWPYLSTVWDYINEAMPFGNARSLNADEIYGITAYLLYMNDMVEDDFVLSKDNFLEVEMPNADGFYFDDRDEVEVPIFSAEACMKDCRDPDFEITSVASDIGVTPETSATEQAAPAEEAPAEEAPAEAQAETAAVAASPELIEAGSKVFKKCAACHKVGEGAANGTGPQLNGILGRNIAGLEDFKYSKGMEEYAAANPVWNADNLSAFLLDPKGTVPKTKMSFNGVKESDIDAIMAFLSAQ